MPDEKPNTGFTVPSEGKIRMDVPFSAGSRLNRSLPSSYPCIVVFDCLHPLLNSVGMAVPLSQTSAMWTVESCEPFAWDDIMSSLTISGDLL